MAKKRKKARKASRQYASHYENLMYVMAVSFIFVSLVLILSATGLFG